MSSRRRRLVSAVLDAVTYALTATVLATVIAALLSFPLGQGLVGVKFWLFLFGFGVFAVAIVVSWPGSAWKRPNLSFDLLMIDSGSDEEETTVPWVDTEPSGESGAPEQTVYQEWVQRLPPARFLPVRPADRLPTGLRLFLAAIAIHGTSFTMEVMFGVGATG